jgi:hypothetical protein
MVMQVIELRSRGLWDHIEIKTHWASKRPRRHREARLSHTQWVISEVTRENMDP